MIKLPQLQMNFRISTSTSTRLMMVVMLLLSGGFVFVFVHSFFSPNVITRGITIYSTHNNQQKFSRQRRRRQQRHHQNSGFNLLLQNQNIGSSDTLPSSSSLSVHSSLIQQEETILSLEWIEFYTPKIKTTSEPEQLLEQQHTPVLFLHGLLGSKRNFATLGKTLGIQLDKPRRVLGVDLRNHGDTHYHGQKACLTHKWLRMLLIFLTLKIFVKLCWSVTVWVAKLLKHSHCYIQNMLRV